MTAISEPARERYLLVKGFSGLGNRMFAALAAILYARVSGRTIVFDWSDRVYSDDGSDVFRHFFVCPTARGVDEIPETDSVVPAIWRGHLHDSGPAVLQEYNRLARARLVRRLERARLVSGSSGRAWFQRYSSIDVSSLAYEAEVAVLALYPVKLDAVRPFLWGEFAALGRMSTHAIQRSLLGQSLVLHPRIQARVDAFKATHFDSPTVGVHLRQSDRRVRVKAILEALDGLLGCRPDLKVFAATDSIEAKELLERRYSDVIMTPHWFPPPGASLHANPECPSRLQNGIEALVDLYLLGGCDFFVGDTTSSFARVARLLAPEERVIDVRPRPSRYTRLQGEIWRRYAASESVVGRIVRVGSRVKHPVETLQLRPRSRRRLLTGTRRSSER